MKKILVLHGSRQTGQLLLGRLHKLRQKLLKQQNIELVALDAPFPHPEDGDMRQWWNREENNYVGLHVTFQSLQDTWNSHPDDFCGMLGFSMGARLVYLAMVAHENTHMFPGLRFGLMASGYDALLPPELHEICGRFVEPQVSLPTLHVWGETDRLIPSEMSQGVTRHCVRPIMHVHEGGHHVPMQAASVRVYLEFIRDALHRNEAPSIAPDAECLEQQVDEIEALQAIFPDEFAMLSQAGEVYEHPIRYQVELPPSDEGVWPPRTVTLVVEYPPSYPVEASPILSLAHGNKKMQFPTSDECLQVIQAAAENELGMPCVLSCVYAARDYFESGAVVPPSTPPETIDAQSVDAPIEESVEDERPMIRSSPPDQIQESNLEGLVISGRILENYPKGKKGGSWNYTIGLVGKPSAGKSTFFNAATAFARQRDDSNNLLGGATMAPHPFTTIDPNVGFCLVPAPEGSCPEDGYEGPIQVGCTHGRDHQGRRLIPILLKDVAGLVPGAYQGRGRGNKFLNDLCDADVLVHVLDASGIADTEGNVVGEDGSNPLDDMAWIRNELIEWVYTNVTVKWDIIQRKGKSKLEGMFAGYGQSQAVTQAILDGLEQFLEDEKERERALDKLMEWDEADVHRLVSAFLGVRFPMALALNKCDLPSSHAHVQAIQDALPLHGALKAVPLSARAEMTFIRTHIERTLKIDESTETNGVEPRPPIGVWNCLQSALSLRPPVLVFPVIDFVHYAPLPGLQKHAISDPSLPSAGMVACLSATGGIVPSLWNSTTYVAPSSKPQHPVALRDCLILKAGSTIDDVFQYLKRLGALGGELVRAEAASALGQASRPVPKHQIVSADTRILKLMTSKKASWQATH